MTSQVTPSKQVRDVTPLAFNGQTRRERPNTLTIHIFLQAASSLENLKMSDSPVKKVDFMAMGKENAPLSAASLDATTEKTKPVEAPKTAPTVKGIDANEPLLQENPHRFVLFPIKYHEVSFVLLVTRHT